MYYIYLFVDLVNIITKKISKNKILSTKRVYPFCIHKEVIYKKVNLIYEIYIIYIYIYIGESNRIRTLSVSQKP